jgi:hypothetical protein
VIRDLDLVAQRHVIPAMDVETLSQRLSLPTDISAKDLVQDLLQRWAIDGFWASYRSANVLACCSASARAERFLLSEA